MMSLHTGHSGGLHLRLAVKSIQLYWEFPKEVVLNLWSADPWWGEGVQCHHRRSTKA